MLSHNKAYIVKSKCKGGESLNAEKVTVGLIALMVSLFVASVILPETITQIQAVNTTAWTFTGYAGATTLWGLLGLLLVVGVVVIVVGWAMSGWGKGGGGI